MTTGGTGRKRVAVIGATGSVGSAILSVCRAHPDEVEVRALAARRPSEKLRMLSREFEATMLCAHDAPRGTEGLLTGPEGLVAIAESPEVDQVLFASSGTAAIPALQAALRAGKEVSLANKESIVVAGPWVMPLVSRPDQLRPLDSEHNAIWQCLHGEGEGRAVRSIRLTASGGPFRTWTAEELKTVTPDMRLPAASCIFWPERRFPAPDFEPPLLAPRTIAFEAPDPVRFPAMRIARTVMERRGAYPALLVGSDEVAVDRFLKGQIGFTDIAAVVEETLESCPLPAPRSLEEALFALEEGRRRAAAVCDGLSGRRA